MSGRPNAAPERDIAMDTGSGGTRSLQIDEVRAGDNIGECADGGIGFNGERGGIASYKVCSRTDPDIIPND